MRIGVPKEIKNHEYRVGLTPSSVFELTREGHELFIETNAGFFSGFYDQDYLDAGAVVSKDAKTVFQQAEMIIKVKEPQTEERALLQPHHILFTYLHLAADKEQTQDLIASRCICIAYETVTDAHGRLPLLAPMSAVAGRMSIQAGAACLESVRGGRGILLGGVPGVLPATVVILGGGVVGSHALAMAVGLGANVSILDNNIEILRSLDSLYGNKINTIYSTKAALQEQVLRADLVIGSVLIPGATAPKLITAEMVHGMKSGSVLVDVAIDQGGCAQTSKITTHDNPTYIVDDVVHYCVANMPGGVARTSTLALNNATLPFIGAIARKGIHVALSDDVCLRAGLNVANGKVIYQAVADAQKLDSCTAKDFLGLVD